MIACWRARCRVGLNTEPHAAGRTTVTFTSSNTAVATVTASVFIPAGQQTPAANPQVTGVIIGTSTITAFAPGFAPATRPANVTVTATFNPGTTNINLTTSTNTTLNISAPAPVGGITFTLKSDNPAVATVPASVTVIQGGTKRPVRSPVLEPETPDNTRRLGGDNRGHRNRKCCQRNQRRRDEHGH